MNYKFLTALAFLTPMHVGVRADVPTGVKKPDSIQSAQDMHKIGYVNLMHILENLPEAKKRNAEMQSFQKQLENELETKYKEYQGKMSAAQQQLDTLTESQKKQKTMELSKLQAVIEELDSQKYPKIEQRYRDIMKPLHDAIQEAVNKVAKEQQYAFIFSKNTEAGPVLLFADSAFDVSELVLEQLKEVYKEVEPPVVKPKANAAPAKSSEKPATKPKSAKK